MTAPPRRIRVLFVITSLAGGGGLHAYYLARHLPRDKFELIFAYGPGYPLDDAMKNLGITIELLPMSRRMSPLTNLKSFFRIRKLVSTYQPDVLISACSIAGMLARIAGWQFRSPINAFVIHAYASRKNQPAWRQFVFRQVERFLDRLTTHYIAVSDATRKTGLDAGILTPQKVHVIHNGIPETSPPVHGREKLRRAWGIPDAAPLVGAVARLEPQKSISDFLKAAAIVSKQFPSARFVVVGNGPQQKYLEQLVVKLDIRDVVIFAGWHDDVPAVMSALDLFCLSSRWEQFPFSVLEAMEAKRPVVATCVDGVPEAVIDGRTGYLVDPGSPEQFADRVLRCLKDPAAAAEMGLQGYQRVRQNFSIDRMIMAYDECFTQWARSAAGSENETFLCSEPSNV